MEKEGQRKKLGRGMKYLFYFLLVICLFACSCKKEDPLPAATQNGANTFGCYVDGKPWIPDGKNEMLNKIPAIQVGFIDDDTKPGKRNDLFFRLTMSDDQLIHLFLKDVKSSRTFYLNKYTNYFFTATNPKYSYGLYYNKTCGVNITDSIHTGKVELTKLDTLRGLVSGTFSFEVNFPHCNKVVKVSSGRFDIDILKLPQ